MNRPEVKATLGET